MRGERRVLLKLWDMKIQFCSDLHLEFPENKKFLKTNPLLVKGDILVLAGDIIPFSIMDKEKDFFSWAADNFEFTYWIPGNHEYYFFDVAGKCGVINERVRSNVLLVNNLLVDHDHIRLLFTTLWSKISPVNYWTVQQNISDFQVIQFGGQKFNPDHFNQLHQESLAFLNNSLNGNSNGNTVVVTHHVPTLMNYPDKYSGSKLNEVFAVELYDLIYSTGAGHWIYGHHHHNVPDFKIGATTLVTNQLGYLKQNEQGGFNHSRVINI